MTATSSFGPECRTGGAVLDPIKCWIWVSQVQAERQFDVEVGSQGGMGTWLKTWIESGEECKWRASGGKKQIG